MGDLDSSPLPAVDCEEEMTERLREIEQRCENATPGPWESVATRCRESDGCIMSDDRLCSRCRPVGVWGNPSDIGDSGIRKSSGVCFPGSHMSVASDQFKTDAYFIAHAREDIPYLLGVIKEQQFKIDALLKLSNAQGEAMKATMNVLKSNGEHSGDAKPLDGTVQE